MNLEDLQNTGIELMKIDVTQYLIDTLYKAKTTRPTPYTFVIELNDSELPSVPSNLINYIITGFISENGHIYGILDQFYHDFTYTEGKELKMTECVYQIDKIENEILNLL